jgi:hypothetical protein
MDGRYVRERQDAEAGVVGTEEAVYLAVRPERQEAGRDVVSLKTASDMAYESAGRRSGRGRD